MAQLTFSPDYMLAVAEIKAQPYQLVKACRDVITNPGQTYNINRKEFTSPELMLIDSGYFAGLVTGMDPGLSNPLLINYINLNVNAVAIRFEEVYNVALGASEFPGNEKGSWPGKVFESGFEVKIQATGSQETIQTQTVDIESNVVQVDYVVDDTQTVVAEDTGGVLQVAGEGGISAALTLQDITYTSVVGAASANNITIAYLEHTPAVAAYLLFQGVQITAKAAGTGGNSITMATTSGAVFGSEVVTVSGSAISIQIAVGQTNAAIITNLLNTYPAAQALVTASTLTPLADQVVQAATHLAHGLAAIGLAGAEVVTVSGVTISVQMQGGVSTATQINTAVNASATALALVSTDITGTGSHAQVVSAAQNLQDGQDALAALMLGQVELSNNGSPIADGTSIFVAYPSQQFTVYQVQVTPSQQAIICRADLINYLEFNAA